MTENSTINYAEWKTRPNSRRKIHYVTHLKKIILNVFPPRISWKPKLEKYFLFLCTIFTFHGIHEFCVYGANFKPKCLNNFTYSEIHLVRSVRVWGSQWPQWGEWRFCVRKRGEESTQLSCCITLSLGLSHPNALGFFIYPNSLGPSANCSGIWSRFTSNLAHD